MADILVDDYNRANNATTPGSPSGVGGPYTAAIGVWGISGNALYTTTTAANLLTFPGAVNIDMSFAISVQNASGGGVTFRYVDSNNYWIFIMTTTGTFIQKKTVGTTYTVSHHLQTNANGDTYQLVARNNMIYGYRNGLLVVAAKDHLYGNGAATAGVDIRNTAVRIDYLTAVDASAVVPTSTAHLMRGRKTKALDVAGVS